MVEVGASKSSHEKLVGKSEFLSQLVQIGALRIVMAHDQRTDVGPGDKHIVFAVVDLHPVLIEAVHGTDGQHASRTVVRLFVDGERRIRHRGRVGGIGCPGAALPDRRKMRQDRAVAVPLKERPQAAIVQSPAHPGSSAEDSRSCGSRERLRRSFRSPRTPSAAALRRPGPGRQLLQKPEGQ